MIKKQIDYKHINKIFGNMILILDEIRLKDKISSNEYKILIDSIYNVINEIY